MLGVTAITAGLLAFSNIDGSVKGSVTPPEGALRAWVISAKDTFRTDITTGTFEIPNVRSGTYRLIIEAKPPYKNVAKDSITVIDGSPVDVGVITLNQ